MSLPSALKKLYLLSTLLLISACLPHASPLQQFEHAAQGAFAAELSDNGDYSIVSSIQHGISLWDNRNNQLRYRWRHHEKTESNDVFIVRISSNNTVALSASRHEFALWDMRSGQNLGYYQVNDSAIRDIQLSANGQWVVYGQVNGKIVHINLKTGVRLEAPLHREKINSIDMSANGRYVLSGGNDHQAYLWDTKSKQIIQQFTFEQRVTMVRLEPQGRFAFVADNQQSAQIWNLSTGQLQSSLVYTARQSIFSTVRFIQDGQFLLTGNARQRLTLWDTQTGLSKQSWKVTARKKTRPKTAVVYSATLWDPETIVSESSAGLLELWPVPKQ